MSNRFSFYIFFLLPSLFIQDATQKELNKIPASCRPGSPGQGLILVSTIDGSLTSIDAKTGEEKWRIKEGPLLESSLSIQKGFTFVANPIDGQLYLLVEGLVTKLPFTIPQLVKVSPCRSNDGILYAGNKKDAWISINPETGEKNSVLAPDASSFCPAKHASGIFIGKTEYQLSMIDSKQRDRQWNVTFIDYSSHLLPPEAGYPLRHFTSSSDGRIMTVNPLTGKILWAKDFNSIIVNIYFLKDDGMHRLPSTAVGKEMFDKILKESENEVLINEILHTDGTNSPSNPLKTIFPTLFVGESTSSGLYAIPALVDEQTVALSKRYIGQQSLIEGPESLKNKQLSGEEEVTSSSPANSNNDGAETLFLGYHETPKTRNSRLVDKTVQNTLPVVYDDPLKQFLPYIEVEDGEDIEDEFDESNNNINVPNLKRRCVGNKCFYFRSTNDGSSNKKRQVKGNGPRLITYEHGREVFDENEEEADLKSAILFIWSRHPFVFVGLGLIFIGILLVITWQCAKLSTITSMQSSSRSRAISNASSDPSSRSSKVASATSPTLWASINSLFSKSNPIRSELLKDDDHWIRVNDQLSYNPIEPLGSGCDGTIVYRGTFQEREVAVKRIVLTNCELIEREINHLQESDAHRNVIRYFCSASDRNFRYLALELCDCNLEEYIKMEKNIPIPKNFDQLNMLRQMTDGIAFLHRINIVHRDVKPKNILLKYFSRVNDLRILISDFGLCKTIRDDRHSISKQSGFTGTKGWAAPEMMNPSHLSLTQAVDIFSMGCVFYYVLSNGHHPFGDSDLLSREINISKGDYDLSQISNEAHTELSLIESMLESNPRRRPKANAVRWHPMFWDKERQLQFLMDVSDRIEKAGDKSSPIERLERNSYKVFGKNWRDKLSTSLQEDLIRHRTYRYQSMHHLLRAMRNKKNHYMELSEELRKSLGSLPNEYLTYFTSKFPRLLMHTFLAMLCCSEEDVFKNYYTDDLKEYCLNLWEEEMKQNHPRFRAPIQNSDLFVTESLMRRTITTEDDSNFAVSIVDLEKVNISKQQGLRLRRPNKTKKAKKASRFATLADEIISTTIDADGTLKEIDDIIEVFKEEEEEE